MKIILHYGLLLLFCTLISGCELLCQAGTGTCGLSDEERYKLLHPKAYGEYFVKSGVGREDWRKDWIACGGMPDGGFSSDAPSGSPTDVLISASKQKRKNLATCMKLRGYEHQEGFEFGKKQS